MKVLIILGAIYCAIFVVVWFIAKKEIDKW